MLDNSNNNNFEKRSYPRFNANIPISISETDFSFKVETKNISCSGFYCQTNRLIPAMTKVAVTMFVPLMMGREKIVKKIDCFAVAVRIEPVLNNYNIGFFFSQINDSDRKILAKYLEQIFIAGVN